MNSLRFDVSRSDFENYIIPAYEPAKLVPVRGQGSRLWDQEGLEYIDLFAGIAVNCLGHAHPKLVQRLQEQSQQLWHLSNAFTNEPALALAKKLCELTFAERVFFCNSGSEANEGAIKMARRYTYNKFNPQKTEIISFHQSFHGRTFMAISIGGQTKYSQGFGALLQGVTHLPFNDIDALRQHASDQLCCIVLEPIQGEGGIIPATPEFMQAVKEVCHESNALMVFDEVQSGIGRTGDLFAYMGYGITPDIMTIAKGIGGGFPLGAFATTQKIAEVLNVGTHGTTYGGNPLATAVGLAVLDEVAQPDFLAQVKDSAQYMRQGLEKINERQNIWKEIRNRGLWFGCELNDSYQDQAKHFVNAGREHRVLFTVSGTNIMRFAPALNITYEEIDVGLELLEQAILEVKQQGG